MISFENAGNVLDGQDLALDLQNDAVFCSHYSNLHPPRPPGLRRPRTVHETAIG